PVAVLLVAGLLHDLGGRGRVVGGVGRAGAERAEVQRAGGGPAVAVQHAVDDRVPADRLVHRPARGGGRGPRGAHAPHDAAGGGVLEPRVGHVEQDAAVVGGGGGLQAHLVDPAGLLDLAGLQVGGVALAVAQPDQPGGGGRHVGDGDRVQSGGAAVVVLEGGDLGVLAVLPGVQPERAGAHRVLPEVGVVQPLLLEQVLGEH